jgi:hypothetical protein
VDLQWTSVVGAARAGSIGPQTISVAPPRSGAVLLKHENSGVVEDEVPEPIREVANSPSVAAVSAPECSTVPQVSAAASSHSVDHSATKTADRTVLRSARVVEHKEQPVTEPPVDLKDEVGIEPDRHVLNTQPLARIAFDQTDPASSQWLNVLAVLGGLLALATLGFVATDFATWL